MKKTYTFLLLFLLCMCNSLLAQNAAAPGSSAVRQVTLGNATVPLDGLWKFHIGDSPQANGASAPRWAQPGFDDFAWGTMDLTPLPKSYDPTFGSRGFVPGWTARGYKGYSGYAWYRLRVNIQEAQDGQGRLFGFERIEAMPRPSVTAVEVAKAAQEFGQQDDISTMRAVRTAQMKAVPA